MFSNRCNLLPALAAVLALGGVASAQVAAGYAFTQSVGAPYVPITGGTLLAAASGTSGVASLDDVNYAVTLPFSFVFDNNPYTAIYVNTNGGVTFGATAPSTTNYTPLSTTTAYNGAVSAFGRDMQGGWVTIADRVTATNTLLNVSDVGPMQVGDFVSGTGIPAGTTITAIVGNVVTLSANVTSTGTGGTLSAFGPWAELRHETLGSSPNQVFVVQWSNFKPFGSTLTTARHFNVNYQIRLYETTNVIEMVYGNCSPGLATSTVVSQVGLRGPNNTFATNVNNRLNVKGTSDWDTSTAGTTNASGEVFNNVAPANVIPNGLTYKWTPVLIATNLSYGAGCGSEYASIYQFFATMGAAAPALSNTAIHLAFTNPGYVVTNSAATVVPPGGGAIPLVLTDDSEAPVVLTTAMPVPGGTTMGLTVCSNAFVSTASGNGTTFAPVVATFLAMPHTVWSSWHDLNPTLVGSGLVKFEEVGTMAYVTYDGVWDYGGTSAADANTIQFQFNETNGDVTIVWGSLSNLGASGQGLLAGYSPGGASLDPGSTNLATGLPQVLPGVDVPALALSAAPAPVLGNTVVYTTSNIPSTTVASAQLISLGQVNPGLPVANAPGCFQYVDLSLSATVLLTIGAPAPSSATFSLLIPNDVGLIGLPLFNQSAALVPGINPLQVITSNGVKSTVSNL